MPSPSTRLKLWIEEYAPAFVLRLFMRRRYRLRGSHAPTASAESVFTTIHDRNAWGSSESPSGAGSEVSHAGMVSAELPALIRELGVQSMLDAPCGDFNWMRHVELGSCRYIGGDIVRSLVEANQERYGSEMRSFRRIDIARDELPHADLIMVRDCFIHFSFEMIRSTLRNVRRSRIRYLLASTYPHKRRNWDIETGGFRPINLQRAPFQLPEPLRTIREDVDLANPAYERHLGLWRVDQIPG